MFKSKWSSSFFFYCPLFLEGCGSNSSRLSRHTSRSSITGSFTPSRKSPSRNYKFSKKHLAETILTRIYISLNVHLPEFTFPWTCTWQNLHFPKRALARNYIFQKTHLAEITSGRNYISPKTYIPEIACISPKFHYWKNLHYENK